jgi:hypothetical protein
MQPGKVISGDAEILEVKGEIYVVYLPHGGNVSLDLSVERNMEFRWFNPRTGEFNKPKKISGGPEVKFDAPDNNDWVLLLKSIK